MAIATSPDVLGDVRRIVQSTIRIDAQRLDIDAEFPDLGIDSIIAMELMENLSSHFGIAFTPAQFLNVNSVRELAAYIEANFSLGERVPAMAPAAAAPTAIHVEAPVAAPAAGDSLHALLDSVKRRYAIDLTDRRWDSIEQIADEMVDHHLERWLQREDVAQALHADAPAAAAAPPRSGDVAIVGLSCRFPDAPDAATFWNNLIEGKSSIREIPASRWDWRECYSEQGGPGKTVSKWGALIEDVDCFDPGFFRLSQDEARLIDPQERLLMQESYRALQDAGIDPRTLAGSDTGVFVGYEYAEYEQYLRRNLQRIPGLVCSSSSPSYYLANRLSFLFDLRGPSESINVNCASSAVAIHRAYQSLVNGESELAIAGAACLHLFADDYVTATQYGLLSPDGSCAVFDNRANGFTRGEGVAAVVLKRLDRAVADGDRIYGVIKASQQSNRGRAGSLSDVRLDAVSEVIDRCYRKAGIAPNQVDYIELNGYAKKWADSFEFEGIKQVFAGAGRAAGKHCALGSLKGNIGHLEPVNGIAGLIKLALSMRHKTFAPTITRRTPSSFIDLDSNAHPLYLAERAIAFDDLRAQPRAPVRAGLSSFADSGVNVHLLIEEYLEPAAAPQADAAPGLFVLSARDARGLSAYAASFLEFLRATPQASFEDLIYTLQTGREAMSHRLAIVASSRQELADKLGLFLSAGPRLERHDIFHADLDGAQPQPLADLITQDMSRGQLQASLRSGQWPPIARLWVHGVDMPWALVWQGRAARKTSLPGYPFARERYWMELEQGGDASAPAVAAAAMPVAPSVDADATDAVASSPRWRFQRLESGAIDTGAAMAPAVKLEAFVRQHIAQRTQRRFDAVDTQANFIELGLDSMAIAELITALGELLRITLPPTLVFKYPEPQRLAAYLAQAYPDRAGQVIAIACEPDAAEVLGSQAPAVALSQASAGSADVLIPIQPKGEAPALFLLPGADGSMLSLKLLCQALGEAQPLYGFDAAGLDGIGALADSVEAAAAINLAAMRAVRPHGPYRLLGYSNGGVVAFEMARRLIEQGERVESLILLDSLCPSQRRESEVELIAQVFAHLLASLGGRLELDAAALQAMPEHARAEHLYGLIAAQGLSLSRDYFLATYRVATASERMCRGYRLPRLPAGVAVSLIRASHAYPRAPADYGWNAQLSAPLRVVEVAADHYTVIEAGAAAAVARAIGECLEPAQAAAQSVQPPAAQAARAAKPVATLKRNKRAGERIGLTAD